ncbi:MAG: hypothetical protein CMF38_06840 [Legionellaceae bacterium]|nr:hypothetical protein [Legionellaceae bacterium]HCA90165.1 hypothetical protein [Legionellales bacterium]|tara:strand:- start:2722 stop:4284 length:1563 start_codon:yes stop_codon:yes gene_type:complete
MPDANLHEPALSMNHFHQLAQQWSAKMASPANSSSMMMTDKLLGQLGIQSPIDAMTFWHSPKGKVILGLITQELKDFIKIEEMQYQMMLDNQQQHQRRLYVLLHHLMQRKTDEMQTLDAWFDAVHKTLHKPHKTSSSQDAHINAAIIQDNLSLVQKLQLCEESILTFDHAIAKSAKQIDKLNTLIETLEKDLTNIEHHQAIVLESLETLNELKHEDLRPTIQSLEQQLKDLTQINYKALSFDERAFNITDEQIIRLKIDALHEKLAVLNKEAHIYDEHGEKTDSSTDAAYVLKPTHHLVKADGLLYLLKIGQSLDTMTAREKEQAAKNLTPELRSVNEQVKHYYQTTRTNIQQQCQSFKDKRTCLTAEHAMLLQKRDELKTQRAQIQSELNQARPDFAYLQRLSQAMPKAALAQPPIKRALMAMHNEINPTLALRFCQAYENAQLNSPHIKFNPKLTQHLKDIQNNLQPGQPIPPQTMRFLQDLVNYARPTIEQQKLNKSASMAPSFHPTPFSMKPPGSV